MTLAGKRALVTGGAGGIGRAVAEALAAAGAHVTVADLNADAAEEVARAIDGEAWALDLSDTDSLAELSVDADILVNNAGIQRIHPIEEFPVEEWRLVQRLMLEAPFLLTRAALPTMYGRGWGRVINVSSAHGLRASPFKSAYVAAKHGLEGLTKTTALEGGPKGVTANAINPGYVRTALVDGQIAEQAKSRGISEAEVLDEVFLEKSAVKRLAEPKEVGALAAFLASDDAALMNGGSYTMDGGWTAS